LRPSKALPDDWSALGSIDGPMPMKDLASCMDYDPSYVTVVADRLESRGLIERQPHPTDRRVKNLVVTEKGAELKATALDRIWSGDNIFRSLSAAERRDLLALVTKLTNEHQA
jgi:DNA-binding MarR family transcriptional regulator